MRYYYTLDKNNIITNFWPVHEKTPSEPYVETKYIYDGYSTVIDGVFNSNKELHDYHQALKIELKEISDWFIDNDWKVNKIVVGEWTTEDSRWIEYLEERTIKRNRQDEINTILNNN